MEKVIKDIIKRNKECVILSPHFDDAVLSCGQLMLRLDKTNVRVINVFTQAEHSVSTFSSRRSIKTAGFNNPHEYYKIRSNEDKKALQMANAKKIDLTFIDALWRKKTSSFIFSIIGSIVGELIAVYPTYRLHVVKGKISKFDLATLRSLKDALHKLQINEKSIVFIPLANGNHVDHVIVRKVAEKIFKSIIYYADSQYNYELNEFELKGYQKVSLSVTESKLKLIQCYSSQFAKNQQGKTSFRRDEIYFIPKIKKI